MSDCLNAPVRPAFPRTTVETILCASLPLSIFGAKTFLKDLLSRWVRVACMLQFELSRSVLAGFDALAPLTLEALLEGYQASQAWSSLLIEADAVMMFMRMSVQSPRRTWLYPQPCLSCVSSASVDLD